MDNQYNYTGDNNFAQSGAPVFGQYIPRPPASQRHPIIFGLLVVLMFFAVMNVMAVIVYLIESIIIGASGSSPNVVAILNDEWVFQGITEFFVMLFGLLAIRIFGCQKCLKEKGRGIKYGMACSGYFIFVGIVAVLSNIALIIADKPEISPAWRIAAYIITFILVGFTEEFYFRGVVANLFYEKHATTPAGIWTATLYSGLIFGLMHLMNGIDVLGASSFEEAAAAAVGPIVQTVSATAMGILLAAIYFRCRNIWLMAGLHAFIDICAGVYAGLTTEASLSSTIDSYTPTSILAIVPYIIATAVLLRPKKLREIIDARNGIDVNSLEYKLAAKGIFVTPPPLAQPQDGQPAPSVPLPPYMGQPSADMNAQPVPQPEVSGDINNAPAQPVPQDVIPGADITASQQPTVTQAMPQSQPPQNYQGQVNAQYQPYNPYMYYQPYQTSQPAYVMPYASDKKSKTSLVRTIVAVAVIIFSLQIMSVAFYAQTNGGLFGNSTEIFAYEYTGSPKVKDSPVFEEETQSFTVPEDGSYRFTFVSLPDNSKAYVEIAVYEYGNANPIYSYTYGGRCSDNVDLELEADKEYTIYMTYDFSDAQDSMSYTTKITVSLDE